MDSDRERSVKKRKRERNRVIYRDNEKKKITAPFTATLSKYKHP